MMLGIEYVEDRATKKNFDPAEKVGARMQAETAKRGLFSRSRVDAYQLAPPIVSSDETIERCIEILAESTKAVLG